MHKLFYLERGNYIMLEPQKKVEILQSTLSPQGLHDYIYGNIVTSTLEYGTDHNAEHLTEAQVWETELGKLIAANTTAAPAPEKSATKSTTK